jgi:hypothetical protein
LDTPNFTFHAFTMTSLMTLALEETQYYLPALRYRLGAGRRQPRAKLLVNGVPKSGTTWMVLMLASLPGYQAVGNFRGDISRYQTVRPGDVIHGHDWYTAELQETLQASGIQVILVVRDLRDQAVSRMFHLKRDETHAWQPTIRQMSNDEALMFSIEGREAQAGLPVLPGVPAWKSFTRQWLAGDKNVICVRYETLLANPVTEMGKLFDRLKLGVPAALVKAIVERNRFERLTIGRKFWQKGRARGQEDADSHFRKGITGDWQNYLNADHRRRFKELAGDWLIEMGYETDFNW